MRRGSRGTTHNRRGPGLIGTVGRTAVIAGTATVVSKGISGSMDASTQKQVAAQQQQALVEQQRFDAAVQQSLAQQMPMQQAAAPVVAPAAGGTDRIAMLQQLAELKSQGILTEAEFEAEKARILAS